MRYVLVGMGSEADMHSPIFEGQVLRGTATTHATAELMPTVVQVRRDPPRCAAQPCSRGWPVEQALRHRQPSPVPAAPPSLERRPARCAHLFPGTQEVDVTLERAGRWDVYCLVNDHFTAGMRATLVVS